MAFLLQQQQTVLRLQKWFANGLLSDFPERFLNPHGIRQMIVRAPNLATLMLPTSSTQLAWKQVRNRITAFGRFAKTLSDPTAPDSLRACFGGSYDPTADNPVSVEDAYQSMWSIEGFSFRKAIDACESGTPFLANDEQQLGQLDAERKEWFPLHTGLGMGVASFFLQTLNRRLLDSIERIYDECQAWSRPKFISASIEPVGLVCGLLLNHQKVHRLANHLEQIDDAAADYFWHGFGRGIYFSPASIPPCLTAIWPDVLSILNRIESERHQMNSATGLGWATRLVNIQETQLDPNHITREFPEQLAVAFKDGFVAAEEFWQTWIGNADDFARPIQEMHRFTPNPF